MGMIGERRRREPLSPFVALLLTDDIVELVPVSITDPGTRRAEQPGELVDGQGREERHKGIGLGVLGGLGRSSQDCFLGAARGEVAAGSVDVVEVPGCSDDLDVGSEMATSPARERDAMRARGLVLRRPSGAPCWTSAPKATSYQTVLRMMLETGSMGP